MPDKDNQDDPAKEWLAETFPEPAPWPEPRAADRTAPEQPAHSRLGDGLKGAAALAAGLYVYDALTEDDGASGEPDSGVGG